MFNLLASNTYFDIGWFFDILQELFSFFSKIGCFALTPSGEFVEFVNGEIYALEYVYSELSFNGSFIANDFAIYRDSFGGSIAGLLGFPISILLGGVPYNIPLVIGILLGVAEWYFILAIAKFILGLVF